MLIRSLARLRNESPLRLRRCGPVRAAARSTSACAPLAGVMLGACAAFAASAAFSTPAVSAIPRAAAAAHDAPSQPAQDAVAWLGRIGDAAQRVSFEGVLTMSAGGRSTSARIAHYGDGRNVVERIETLDGPPRIIFRHNAQVKTVWPELHHAVTGPQDSLATLSGALRAADDGLLRHYELSMPGHDRIAGRGARVLLLRPRDEWRLGHRLWADEATGLLLRAEVLAADGRVLEWSALSSVEIGVPAQSARVLDDMRRDDGLSVRQQQAQRADLRREGWALGALPPGFRLLGAVNRPAAVGVADAPAMLQVIFSDGLAHVSVFIEAFDARAHRRGGLSAAGATQTLARRAGPWWLTAVGDVPAPTLQTLSAALRRER